MFFTLFVRIITLSLMVNADALTIFNYYLLVLLYR